MFTEILAYSLIILGGCLWGIAITIYWGRKCRVIHDLIGLIFTFIVSAMLIMIGIEMCRENANKEVVIGDNYNPVVVEHLDLSDYQSSRS